MSSPVLYHEDMHNAVWSWIKDWCEMPNAWQGKERGPRNVLREIVGRIYISMGSEKPFVIEGGEQGLSQFQNHNFSTFICYKGQRLYDREEQEKMTWVNMKSILEFYISDMEHYIRRVNELRLNRSKIIERFELNLPPGTSSRIADVPIDLDVPSGFDPQVYTHAQTLKNSLIWSRYLTGTTIWEEGNLHPILLARGEPYWSELIVSELENLEIGRYHIFEEQQEQISEQQEQISEQQKKKNDAIRKIQGSLDEVQEDIGDGLYLELMNVMKDHFVVSE